MRTPAKHEHHSPFDVLTELAVQGRSSLAEGEGTALDLAKQENEILLTHLKQRIAEFVPAVATTDMVRHGVETLIGMQQDLLTSTAKQTMEWIKSEKPGKNDHTVQLMELVRVSVKTFTRSQEKFLEVVQLESAKAASGKLTHEEEISTRTRLAVLAREATNAFIEAQKRLLDVMGHQVNVNLDASTNSVDMISPAEPEATASLTREEVKKFFKTESDLVEAMINPRKAKTAGRAKTDRNPNRHHKRTAV